MKTITKQVVQTVVVLRVRRAIVRIRKLAVELARTAKEKARTAKQTIDEKRARRESGTRDRAPARSSDDSDQSRRNPSRRPLDERSRDTLYELAKEKEIRGRSRMTKDELVDALRRAR